MDSVFTGLSLIIVIAAIVAFFMRVIGQPLTISYIITGILVGPAVLNIASSPDSLSLFSDIGIALLLFIIGLGLNPNVVREVSRPTAFVCFSQIIAVTTIGAIVGSAFGLTGNESLFLGASLAFSSTIIVLKLLSDKKEDNRLYGKIAISVALVQDLVAFVLILVTSAVGSQQSVAFGSLISLTIKALVVGWLIYAISYKLLSQYRKVIAGNQEFLFLFAMAWGLGAAALFSKIGLSSEIGALLAGICLAPLPYAQEIGARLRPLRDFFLIVFFISLGANLTFSSLSSHFGLIVVALLIAVILKPIISMAVMGWLGYTKRTSFKASVSLAQVSEFSIVLILLGYTKGFISGPIVSVIVFVALVSIAASTYMITFNDKLFAVLERYLGVFERRKTHGEPVIPEPNDIILFGYQKGGHEFVKVFKQLKRSFVVIDYVPEIIDTLERKHINHLYGDVTDIELLEEAGAPKAKLIVSTTDDYEVNKFLIDYLRENNADAVTILQSDSPRDATRLYRHGASYVMLPHLIGSEKISAFVLHSELRKSNFKKFRDKHIKYLADEFGSLEETADHEKLGQTIIKSMAKLTKAKS